MLDKSQQQIFSGVRLSVARRWRNITQEELAAHLKVTKGAISNLENGKTQQPDSQNLTDIAEFLSFSTSWFYAPSFETFTADDLTFRARRKMSKAVREKAVCATDIAVEVVSPALRSRFELPSAHVPDLSAFDPEEAARQLRIIWKMGNGPIRSVVRLLETKGIEFFNYYHSSADMDAWSAFREERFFIFLNLFVTAGEREQFDAAHELGHLVLHRAVNSMPDKDVISKQLEDEANLFASAFLMPKETFWADALRTSDLQAALRAKTKWHVSAQAAFMRSHQIGVLSRWYYSEAFKRMNGRGWRTNEPLPMMRSTPRVHELALNSLCQKGISPDTFAASMHLKIGDLAVLMPSVNSAKVGEGLTTPGRILTVVPKVDSQNRNRNVPQPNKTAAPRTKIFSTPRLLP